MTKYKLVLFVGIYAYKLDSFILNIARNSTQKTERTSSYSLRTSPKTSICDISELLSPISLYFIIIFDSVL